MRPPLPALPHTAAHTHHLPPTHTPSPCQRNMPPSAPSPCDTPLHAPTPPSAKWIAPTYPTSARRRYDVRHYEKNLTASWGGDSCMTLTIILCHGVKNSHASWVGCHDRARVDTSRYEVGWAGMCDTHTRSCLPPTPSHTYSCQLPLCHGNLSNMRERHYTMA